MNSRKEWIDGLRALAMLIVMTWHISNGQFTMVVQFNYSTNNDSFVFFDNRICI